MKKLILLSIISIQLFAKVINGVYVPEPNEKKGNEIEIYPNLAEQINKAIEEKKRINQEKPIVEVIINNQSDTIDDNLNLNVKFNKEKLKNIKSIDEISDLKENLNENNLKIPLGVEEIIIDKF